MNKTQILTDSLAMLVRGEMLAAGVDLPVVGEVNDPEPEHTRVEVRVESAEEIIPGNETYRVDGVIALRVPALLPADEAEGGLERVAAPVRRALARDWRRFALPDPRGDADAEYAARPYLVLALIPTVQSLEEDGEAYRGIVGFRAYVQF